MKSKKVVQKSKTKIKKQRRKEQYISLKKIQNEQRQNIIKSLEQHKKNTAQLINNLPFEEAKYLGQKRKTQSKEKKSIDKEKEEIIEKSIEENDDSNSESESFIVEEHNIKMNTNKPNNVVLSQEKVPTQEEILAKIHEERERERMLEEIEELKDIIYDDNIFRPPESAVVLVSRTQEIIDSRKNLPVIQQEHDIMYAIDNSLVTVVSGETGSGKSTQIPQFIYEKGYTNVIGQIAITQPRRVAARALATRLAEELNVHLGNEVGYQIRYETQNISNKTVIKFLTDGILLKELETDQLLMKYSVIIIDEAHERTINTDLLLGFISQIIRIRYVLWKKRKKYNINGIEKDVYPLRLVIMSATLRVEEFTESNIFLPSIKPRHVEVSSRQYKVTVLHSKKTHEDYIGEAFKLCVKIHKRLPDGNVLVFLTGKREILDLCKKLNDEFSGNNYMAHQIEKEEKIDIKKEEKKEEEKPEEEKIIDEEKVDDTQMDYKPVIVLPLYSSMSPEEQMKIYKDNGNKRMFVISTNVAETSLTIPNIRYVIDSGKVKKRIYKSGLSFSTFEIEWISQASASQRAGRAGRTCEGYCYRLYSNGLYVKMEKFNSPQISECPLSQVVLTMKAMKVKNIHSFPFLTKPNSFFLEKAIEHLNVIGALESNDDENSQRMKRIYRMLISDNEEEIEDNFDSSNINDIGKLMAKFPIEPKLSKMLIMANGFHMIEYAIIIVAFMSVENPFDFNSISYKDKVDAFKSLHIYNNTSDVIAYLNLMILTLKNKQNTLKLNQRKLDEIQNLINQLYGLCAKIFKTKLTEVNQLCLSTNQQNGILMQILLCSFIDNIARKKILYDEVGNEVIEKNETVLKKKTIYECNENNIECKLHYLSLVNDTLPDYVIYKEIIKEQKSFLQCVSAISPDWLYNIGGPLVKDTLSVSFKEPYYNKKTDSIFCFVNIVYGYKQWDIPNVAVEMKKNDINYYRYMARFILDGDIIEQLKEFKGKLNSNSNVITNKFSDMYVKVGKLVRELKENDIDSREKLKKKLKENKNYLRDIIMMWYDDTKVRSIIKYKWPFI